MSDTAVKGLATGEKKGSANSLSKSSKKRASGERLKSGEPRSIEDMGPVVTVVGVVEA